MIEIAKLHGMGWSKNGPSYTHDAYPGHELSVNGGVVKHEVQSDAGYRRKVPFAGQYR